MNEVFPLVLLYRDLDSIEIKDSVSIIQSIPPAYLYYFIVIVSGGYL